MDQVNGWNMNSYYCTVRLTSFRGQSNILWGMYYHVIVFFLMEYNTIVYLCAAMTCCFFFMLSLVQVQYQEEKKLF